MPNWMHTNASPMYTALEPYSVVWTTRVQFILCSVFVYDRTNCMEAKKENDDWECVGTSVLGPLYRAMCYIMLECRTQCHSLCTFYTHLNSSAVLNRFVAVMRCLQAIMLFSFTVTLKYCPYTLYDPSPNAKITVSSAISNLIINVLFLLKRISSRKFRKRRLLFGVFVCSSRTDCDISIALICGSESNSSDIFHRWWWFWRVYDPWKENKLKNCSTFYDKWPIVRKWIFELRIIRLQSIDCVICTNFWIKILNLSVYFDDNLIRIKNN